VTDSYDLACATVAAWAEQYRGEPYHAMFCDPPYELGFMGKRWDRSGVAFRPETWAGLAAHLYPGAFGMAFASSRGWHRLACAIEDAGLIIHASLFGWAFGSGFPKATRIDLALDKIARGHPQGSADPESVNSGKYKGGCSEDNPVGQGFGAGAGAFMREPGQRVECKADLPEAATWEGHRYGLQALKPALEPIILFQKPYEGRPVDCITETGAGALWIDGGRIAGSWERNTPWKDDITGGNYYKGGVRRVEADPQECHSAGRWPANLILQHHPDCQRAGTRRVRGNGRDGSPRPGGFVDVGHDDNDDNRTSGPSPYADPDGYEVIDTWECVDGCPVKALGEQSGECSSGGYPPEGGQRSHVATYGKPNERGEQRFTQSTGTAARFFFQASWSYEIAERLAEADPVYYCAKASRAERDAGLDAFEPRTGAELCDRKPGTAGLNNPRAGAGRTSGGRNTHPTVKPISLARHLATLLLPPAAYAPRRLLVPFAGSGSEMIGANLAGWEQVTGIEMLPENVVLAMARLRFWQGWSEATGLTDPAELLQAAKGNELTRLEAWQDGQAVADAGDLEGLPLFGETFR